MNRKSGVPGAGELPFDYAQGKPHSKKGLEHKKRGAREGSPFLFGVLGVRKWPGSRTAADACQWEHLARNRPQYR